MEDGVGGIDERMIVVIVEAEPLAGEVAAKDAYTGIQVLEEFGKVKMELERLPEALAGFLPGFRADKKIQLIRMAGEETRHEVAAEISGGTCQENSHRRMLALQRIAAEAASSGGADQLSARGSRASSGLPSIKG